MSLRIILGCLLVVVIALGVAAYQAIRWAEGPAIPRAIERGRLGDLGVVTELAAMLRSSEPLAVRREAAQLLVSLPPRTETRPLLAAALALDDPELRDWVAVAATRLGDAEARTVARGVVARQEPRAPRAGDLRTQAALALAHVGDPAGVTVLAGALDDCAESVLLCQYIIIKLGSLKDARAVPKLLERLPDVQNRREMVAALGEIADARATEPLAQRLKADEYVPVRAEAARALGRIGGPAARAALEWSAQHEREPSVLAAARAALGVLGAEN